MPFSLIELFYNCFLFGSNEEVSILRVKSKASIKNIELLHHNVMLTKDWCVLKHEMFQKVKLLWVGALFGVFLFFNQLSKIRPFDPRVIIAILANPVTITVM